MSAETLGAGMAQAGAPRGTAPAMNYPKVLSALFVVMSITIAMIITGLALGVHGPDIACLLWAAAAFAISMIPVALDIGRPPHLRHTFLSLLSVIYMVNFVIPVLTTYIPAVGPMDPAAMNLSNLLPSDIARGQWMAILGILCLFIGYASPIRSLVAPMLPKTIFEWSHGAALVATCTMVAAGWIVFIAGALGILPASLGSGLIGGFSSSILAGSALLTATYLKYRSRIALLLVVILIPMTTMIMFMTGSKTAILMPSIMVVMTWIVVHREIRLRWIAIGVMAVIMLYPLAQFWRQDILQFNTLTIADVAGNPGPALQRTANFLSSNRAGTYFEQGLEATGRRLDVIGVSSVIIRDTPSISPFQYGRTLALVPLGFIPRILWADKPVIHIGQWVNDTYTQQGYLAESNLAPSWIGEFYLNFGIMGVMVGMAILGLMLRSIHELLMRPSMVSIPMIVTSVTIMSRSLIGIQGGIVDAINGPVVNLLPLVVMHLIMRVLGGVRPTPVQHTGS